MKKRLTKTPEFLRASAHSSSDFAISPDENERTLDLIPTSTDNERLTDSRDSLAWDSYSPNLETDEMNEAFFADKLDLEFKQISTDFMRVYDFTNTLPLTSEFKSIPKKTKSKSKLKILGNLLTKRKGGTPPKRH